METRLHDDHGVCERDENAVAHEKSRTMVIVRGERPDHGSLALTDRIEEGMVGRRKAMPVPCARDGPRSPTLVQRSPMGSGVDPSSPPRHHGDARTGRRTSQVPREPARFGGGFARAHDSHRAFGLQRTPAKGNQRGRVAQRPQPMRVRGVERADVQNGGHSLPSELPTARLLPRGRGFSAALASSGPARLDRGEWLGGVGSITSSVRSPSTNASASNVTCRPCRPCLSNRAVQRIPLRRGRQRCRACT